MEEKKEEKIKIKVINLEKINLINEELKKLREKVETYLNANIIMLMDKIKATEIESLTKGYGYCKPQHFAAMMTKGLVFSAGAQEELKWTVDDINVVGFEVGWRGISVILETPTGVKLSLHAGYCGDEEDLKKITKDEFEEFEKWRKMYTELIISELPNAITEAFDNLYERLYENIKYRIIEETIEKIKEEMKELEEEEEDEEEEDEEEVQYP